MINYRFKSSIAALQGQLVLTSTDKRASCVSDHVRLRQVNEGLQRLERLLTTMPNNCVADQIDPITGQHKLRDTVEVPGVVASMLRPIESAFFLNRAWTHSGARG